MFKEIISKDVTVTLTPIEQTIICETLTNRAADLDNSSFYWNRQASIFRKENKDHGLDQDCLNRAQKLRDTAKYYREIRDKILDAPRVIKDDKDE